MQEKNYKLEPSDADSDEQPNGYEHTHQTSVCHSYNLAVTDGKISTPLSSWKTRSSCRACRSMTQVDMLPRKPPLFALTLSPSDVFETLNPASANCHPIFSTKCSISSWKITPAAGGCSPKSALGFVTSPFLSRNFGRISR